MSATYFCNLLELPSFFVDTVETDKQTFSEEFVSEAVNMCRLFYPCPTEKTSTKQIKRYVRKLVDVFSSLANSLDYDSEYRLRSKYKPKSAVVVFVLILRLLDTHMGQQLMNKYPTMRVSAWDRIEAHQGQGHEFAQKELDFLEDTFEPGKRWLSREMNLNPLY